MDDFSEPIHDSATAPEADPIDAERLKDTPALADSPETEDATKDVVARRNTSPYVIRRSDQVVVAVGIGIAALMIALWCVANWFRDGRLLEFEQVAGRSRLPEFQVDLNQAEWQELAALPELGEGTARDIVAYREKNGPFQRVEDLELVDGVGPKTMESLTPYILPIHGRGYEGEDQRTFDAETSEVVDVKEDASGRVNINVATREQLEAAPGIGPVLAQRILESRERIGPFQRLEDVARVSGIGPATLERLRSYFYVDSELTEESEESP